MLHEKIRSVAIALGELAGRVNPNDWQRLSGLRDELAALANDAEAMERQPLEEDSATELKEHEKLENQEKEAANSSSKGNKKEGK